MHSIKREARNIAWRYGDGEYTNYNPFAKRSRSYGRYKSGSDEEAALGRHRTADEVPTREEEARYKEMSPTEEQEFGFHTQHANTAPNYPASVPTSSHTAAPSSEINPAVAEKHETGAAPGEKGEAPPYPESQTNGHADGMRKRLKVAGWFGQPDRTLEEGNMSRSSTTDTQSRKKSVWKQHKGFMPQVRAVFLGSWINVLLLCVPVGFVLNYIGLEGNAAISIFVVNFIAIVPLAAMLSFATEELAMYVGETLGGLLNASFGNATELIVGVIALAQNKILIVQTSLIGSMLSNLLLVLGMCFFFGGINRKTQFFNITVAQTAASMLALSIGSLIIPTAFQIFGTADQSVGAISRGTAVILLSVYAAYLYFQLSTHADMYNEPSQKSEKNKRGKKEKGDVFRGLASMGAGTAAASGGQIHQSNLVQDSEADEEETPTLSVLGALVTLTCTTVLLAFCSEFMVTGIDPLIATGGISEEFVGLILVPIVGNAAEHATAVTVAIKDKMDLAIGVAVGSSMQIALLVLPLMVIIGWCGVGTDAMTLDFDGFQVSVLFIAVLLVNYLIQDGQSHWLEGWLLMCLYIIIATTAWFYPATGVAG